MNWNLSNHKCLLDLCFSNQFDVLFWGGRSIGSICQAKQAIRILIFSTVPFCTKIKPSLREEEMGLEVYVIRFFVIRTFSGSQVPFLS